MSDQRIDQRTRGVTCARMHDETRRLVDDDERIVLVDDVEWDRLWA
jgi:hypothetical protein